jgi:NitT/TauT family transport system permease protein
MQTAILFVAIIAVFPVAISTAAGFERVPERHLDLLESVAANPRRTLLGVEARYALPDVFAGLKQAAALSVIGAIVAEWIVSTSGLGYLILVASETVQTTVLLAALLLLLAVGLAIYGSVALFQRVTVGPSSRYAGPT